MLGPLSGKRLEVLQEVAPGIKRVLVLMTPHESIAEASFQSLAEVAPKLGIELLRYDVTSKADIEQRLKALPRDAVDAIYYVPSNMVLTHLDLLIHKAKGGQDSSHCLRDLHGGAGGSGLVWD